MQPFIHKIANNIYIHTHTHNDFQAQGAFFMSGGPQD